MVPFLLCVDRREGHETAATARYLVLTDSVSHTAGIHLPDPEVTL
ncbi:DUF5431 family protein [Mangrovibacter phragmitis]